MFSQPGKKLLFMGNDIAQWREWNHDSSLDWHLLEDTPHQQIQLLVGTLNHLYRTEPALHELDAEPAGFHWLEADDAERSVLVYERVAKRDDDRILCALNFTPIPRTNYRVGVPRLGFYKELLNTDAVELGGSGQGNLGAVEATPVRAHRREASINLTIPPLGAVWLKRG
jgi:1,4-alpha-glucan branching enzyme